MYNMKIAYLCGLMKKHLSVLLFFGLLATALTACKSEFERIRTSGDAELILQKAFYYYDKQQYQRALSLFDLVISAVRASDKSEEAFYKYAWTHYNLKQYTLAAYYFKNFSNTFINSVNREEAAYMAAYCNYLQSPSFRLDQTNTLQAIDEFQTFANLFPNSKRVEECNRLIDECRRKLEAKAFAEGKQYYDMRLYQSAVISFDNLLRDYPESPDAERVMYLIAKADYLLSANSVLDKKEARYQETVIRCNDFLEKYPRSKLASEVKNMRKDAEREIGAVRKKLKSLS